MEGIRQEIINMTRRVKAGSPNRACSIPASIAHVGLEDVVIYNPNRPDNVNYRYIVKTQKRVGDVILRKNPNRKEVTS